MVAGMKFLSKKAFNPQNLSNQKRVWEREEAAKQEIRRKKEREEQLRRERDDEELAKARGDIPKVNFLYRAPPGCIPEEPKKKEPNPTTTNTTTTVGTAAPMDLFDRQPGDDDATAAFRQLLASSCATGGDGNSPVEGEHDANVQQPQQQEKNKHKFGVVLQGAKEGERKETDSKQSKANLSVLEKAVGRRKTAGSGVTLEEQIQKFPALANAPRQKGLDESVVGVTFKPLGTQIRHVKCFQCGVWGHSKGDRECQMSGWDPFSAQGSLFAAKRSNDPTRGDDPSDTVSSDRKRRKQQNDSPDESRRDSKTKKRDKYYSSDDSDDDSRRGKDRKEDSKRSRSHKKRDKKRSRR